MTISFTLRRSYGHDRYYAACPCSTRLLELAERKCFLLSSLETLAFCGIVVRILTEDGTELKKLTQNAETSRRVAGE